ncbi:MAG: ABC transporter permease [Ruminococcaceae bacterium]|nr:ABC transporter permease [Oscillospiraceae bacterium]
MQNEEKQWTAVIKPQTGWFELNLRELFHYKDLIFLFVKRNFTSLYKQTILGPLWAIIQPFLTTVVFTLVFGGIAKLDTGGVPSFIFYMCGNIAWGYFSQCFTSTANTFTGNAGIFGKVYFPRMVIPISVVLTNLISFFIQLIFFLCFWIYYLFTSSAIQPNWTIALLPLMLLQMAILGLGFGIIVSSVTTKYRDLSMLVSFGIQLWMYATPVAYSTSLIANSSSLSKYMGLYMLNPMTPLIESFRNAFLGTGSVDISYILISWAITLIVLFVGVILFNRVEKSFMDTV